MKKSTAQVSGYDLPASYCSLPELTLIFVVKETQRTLANAPTHSGQAWLSNTKLPSSNRCLFAQVILESQKADTKKTGTT